MGTVLSVADGIARLHGLENCMSFEMLELPRGVTGLALNLESDNVGAVLFGEWEHVSEGDTVKRTGTLLEIPVGERLLGRIVDPLGRPLDGKGAIDDRPGAVPPSSRRRASFSASPSRSHADRSEGDRRDDPDRPRPARAHHRRPPDRQTAIAIDTIINNKDTGVVSVYVAIGQRMSTVVALAQTLEEYGALENTVIVAAPADEAAPIKFMAPTRAARSPSPSSTTAGTRCACMTI